MSESAKGRPTSWPGSADFFERFAAQDLAIHSQSAPLVVLEQDSLLAMRSLEHLVLCSQVLDHLLMLAIDPADENDKIQLL